MNNTDKGQADHVVYSFGEFSLDSQRGELHRGKEWVSLRPKTLSALLYLVQHRGELVTRADLIESVWHNASVSDDSITQCIVEIRKVLGDADHTMIRTVPRRGFVFELPVERHLDVDRAQAETAGRQTMPWRWSVVVALPLAIIVAIWIAISTGDRADSPSTPDRISIAVLAFTDMTAAGDRQYFGDGMAEEILNHLAQVRELRVISRSSSFSYRQDPDISAIAEELSVDFVLEGSVRGAGDELRITAQLIDAATDAHVWAESYDRRTSVDNLIAVQHEIATNVAAVIGVETGAILRLPPEQNAAVNPAALDQYLQGLFYLRKLQTGPASKEDYDAVLEYMRAAIEADPGWAPPHAAIGTSLHFFATSHLVESNRVSEMFAESRQNLLNAIRLDPQYGPAYRSLAFIAHNHDLDFESAEALYAKAEALGDQGYWGRAIMLKAQGRIDEAIDVYRQAVRHDPLSDHISVQLANSLGCAGRFEEAAQYIDSLLQKSPDHLGLLDIRAYLSVQMGDTAHAQQIIDEHRTDEFPMVFGNAMALIGMREEAEAALDEIDGAPQWIPRHYTFIAVALGQPERALNYLEQVAAHEPRKLFGLQCPAQFRSLAGDDRFRTLLVDAGIPFNLGVDER